MINLVIASLLAASQAHGSDAVNNFGFRSSASSEPFRARAEYHIVGGTSELNFNIRANPGEFKVSEPGIGMRYAVLNIAMDLLNSKSAEPVQLGVRAVIERAVIDLVSPFYGVDPQPCLEYSGPFKAKQEANPKTLSQL